MAMPEALFVSGDEGLGDGVTRHQERGEETSRTENEGGRGRPVPPQQDTCARREAEVCPETREGMPTTGAVCQHFGRGIRDELTRHQGNEG